MNYKAAVVSVLVLLAGCVSINTPPDLRVLNLEVVEHADQIESMCEDPYPMPPKPFTWPEGCKKIRKVSGARPEIKVTFATETNLFRLARDNSFPIGVTAKLCLPDRVTRLIGGNVYVDKQPVDMRAQNFTPEEYRALTPPQSYYFYIDVAAPAGPNDIPRNWPYDLRVEAHDVCFKLAGGSGVTGYRSNEVVIPKAMIRATLGGAVAR